MDSCELVTVISSLACAMARVFSDDELSLFAAAFTELGDSLALIVLNNSFKKEK